MPGTYSTRRLDKQYSYPSNLGPMRLLYHSPVHPIRGIHLPSSQFFFTLKNKGDTQLDRDNNKIRLSRCDFSDTKSMQQAHSGIRCVHNSSLNLFFFILFFVLLIFLFVFYFLVLDSTKYSLRFASAGACPRQYLIPLNALCVRCVSRTILEKQNKKTCQRAYSIQFKHTGTRKVF
jgi:hypothetical protein